MTKKKNKRPSRFTYVSIPSFICRRGGVCVSALLAVGLFLAPSVSATLSKISQKHSLLKYVASTSPATQQTKTRSSKKNSKGKGVSSAAKHTTGLWKQVLKHNGLIKLSHSAGVAKQIRHFLAHKEGVQQRVDNASAYLGYVYEQTEKKGIPSEFALLPMIESNYDPKKSNGNSAGLWQLETRTARMMKVFVGSNYDGRKDVVLSTDASLDHLKGQYKRFHSWLLAAAAYNCGGGRVAHAIRNNKRLHRPTTYWAIRSQLPPVTRAYVPRLIAMSYVLSHAKKYALELPNLPTAPAIKALYVNKRMTLMHASKLSGAPLKKLKKLNPALKKGMAKKGKPYHFVVPTEYFARFKAQNKP